MISDDHGNNLDSFRISLEAFKGPLVHKPVTGQELSFALSYSQPALAFYLFKIKKKMYCRPSKNNFQTSPNLKFCSLKIAHSMTYIQWLWLQQQNTAVASKASCSLSFSGLYSRPVVCFSRALTEYENTGMRLPCLELLLGRQAPLLYHIGLKNEKNFKLRNWFCLI